MHRQQGWELFPPSKWEWLDSNALGNAISFGELLLALLAAGLGGVAVGRTSAVLRMRVEVRKDLLRRLTTGAVAPPILREVLDLESEDECARQTLAALLPHGRALADARREALLLPLSDRLYWQAHARPLEDQLSGFTGLAASVIRFRDHLDYPIDVIHRTAAIYADTASQYERYLSLTGSGLRSEVAVESATSISLAELSPGPNDSHVLGRRKDVQRLLGAHAALVAHLERRLRPDLLSRIRRFRALPATFRLWIRNPFGRVGSAGLRPHHMPGMGS